MLCAFYEGPVLVVKYKNDFKTKFLADVPCQESSYTVIMAAPRHHAMPTTLDFNSVRKFALKKDKVLGLEEDRTGRGRQWSEA